MQIMNFDKTVPFRKRYGVAGFVQTLVVNFFDVVLLNLMFILTALPLVTAGAAVCALHRVCTELAHDRPVYVCRDYFAAFRRFLRRDMWSAHVFTAVTVTGLFGFYCYFSWAHDYSLLYILAAATLCAVIVITLISAVYFPYITSHECSRRQALGRSLRLAVARLDRTAPAVAIGVISFAVPLMTFPYGIVLLLVFPFSVTALAACYAVRGII